MSSMVYFDTSFLAPLVLQEQTSVVIQQFIDTLPANQCCTSRWAPVEFASLVARKVRMKELNPEQADQAIALFGHMLNDSFEVFVPQTKDFQQASMLLQTYKSGLRAGDALHVAVAQNRKVSDFYTLDRKLVESARELGFSASTGPVG